MEQFFSSFKQVFREIENVLGSNEATPSYAELQNMTLLTRFIKEVMRLYPAAPIIARSSPQDLKCGDYVLPAGKHML